MAQLSVIIATISTFSLLILIAMLKMSTLSLPQWTSQLNEVQLEAICRTLPSLNTNAPLRAPTRPPHAATTDPKISPPTKKYMCPNAFIDCGSNRGDSIAKFLRPDQHQGSLADFFREKKWNPKEFCVFGFEGNPHFNKTLSALEAGSKDKALHVEIRQQTVITGKEGPVTFYLDTVNPNGSFWGSSLLEHHWDVQRSGKVKVVADGINLGKFVSERVDPAGIVSVKMDIEGAEYDVVRDLVDSGMLCRKDARGNNLFDFMNIEFHHIPLVEKPDGVTPTRDEYVSVMRWVMHACGVAYSPSTD